MGAVYDEFAQELAGWSRKYAGQPAREILRLLFLALEREELVSISYRESLILKRLHTMPVSSEIQALIHHALMWAWKDEQMHSLYLRGAILKLGSLPLRVRAYVRQMMGATGGWAGSVCQHIRWRHAPLSHTLAMGITSFGMLTGQVPRQVIAYLRFRPFRDFCLFNVDAEQTAALCYRRMLEILPLLPDFSPQFADQMRRVYEDEVRHEQIFQIIADALDTNDTLTPGETFDTLAEKIAAVGEFFLPRALRCETVAENPVGSGGRVCVRQGTSAEEKLPLLYRILEEARLPSLLQQRAHHLGKPVSEIRVTIKTGFMLGYDRKDRSHITDPELLATLGRYLREQGCREVSVAESPNLYDRYYAHRSVREVAAYFGIESPDYRLVDLSEERVPHEYGRGMAQHTIGRSWKEADFRITFGKMRSHPTEMVYLTVGNMDSLGDRWDAYLFAERQAHRDTALMMLMNDFPPHFALLDAYDSAADGMLGMMGCPRPRTPRRFYAGADALAVDMVATRHMGLSQPRRAATLNTACHWFGDPTLATVVDGVDTPLSAWRGPYQNEWTTLLSLLAYPVFEFASGRGTLFVPPMDTRAFPPLEPEPFRLRCSRRVLQAFLRLRHR